MPQDIHDGPAGGAPTGMVGDDADIFPGQGGEILGRQDIDARLDALGRVGRPEAQHFGRRKERLIGRHGRRSHGYRVSYGLGDIGPQGLDFASAVGMEPVGEYDQKSI